MVRRSPTLQLASAPTGTWVQVDRSALERWSLLTIKAPRASALLQVMVGQMGRHNALVTSQDTLARLMGCNVRTVQRALDVLVAENWIEVRRIGPSGNGSAYVVNSRVAWSGQRDGIRYALFEAAVLVSDAEQPDQNQIGAQPPLEQVPLMLPGEQQLPTGPGLPPPSQPSLPSLEPDLPARIAPPTEPQSTPPVDPAVLAAWSGRPRNDRFGLAKRVIALQTAAGEIALEASQLADHPVQLLTEATRLGLRF